MYVSDTALDLEALKAVVGMQYRHGHTKQALLNAVECVLEGECGEQLLSFAGLVQDCLRWGITLEDIRAAIAQVPINIDNESAGPDVQKLLVPLSELRFPDASAALATRISSVISHNDRVYVGDLVQEREHDLKRSRGCGDMSLTHIKDELARRGFQLGMSKDDPRVQEFERLRPRRPRYPRW